MSDKAHPDPAARALIEAHAAHRDAGRPIADRLAKAAMACGDAVAAGFEATPKQGDELLDAACAFRDWWRSTGRELVAAGEAEPIADQAEAV